MVHYNYTDNVVSYQTEFTAKIAGNDLSTKLAPLVRSIEYLVKVSEFTEGQFRYTTVKLKILKPVVERVVTD